MHSKKNVFHHKDLMSLDFTITNNAHSYLWVRCLQMSHLCADPEGGGGMGFVLPMKITKIGFLSNTGPDPLKITKLPSQQPAFKVGPSLVRQPNAILNGVWLADR